MTNEAMAFEIIQDSEYLIDDFGKAYFDCEMAEKMLTRMANWKDSQFKEYLEKRKEGIENAIMVFGGDLIKYAKIDLLKEIINEFFKED